MNTKMDADLARDRAKGCLLGGAVGDALGAAVEFMSLDEIRNRFGPSGVAGYEQAYGRRGAITDDTQMTLWTAEGLIRADNRFRDRGIASMPHAVYFAYRRWLATQDVHANGVGEPLPGYVLSGWLYEQDVLRHRRAPGGTCLSALRSGQVGSVSSPLNDSKGCGGIMRVAPVGLICLDPFPDGMEIAALIHGHPTGYLAAGAFALIIAQVSHGVSLPDAIGAALRELNEQPSHEETTRAIKRAQEYASSRAATPETIEALGKGWIAEEALAIALFCALTAPDFRTGVLLAVNHGGDSDSTGSLVGQILGAQHGQYPIPGQWLADLEGREVVEQIADGLIRHFIDPPPAPPMPKDWPWSISWPRPDDLDRYPPN